ncbi:hypothetical protein SISSUDRAFT_1056463 [Sistotremastrum suecicum HHB10207 ss-3]|uniref:Uncharacterized protein n=1 Tax=Sistotremastrum suecicum HHB10207 ss-3 TaxID=1314776 RepID=A0A165WTA0_9AGAM|nr:hypothetical protein SISSUDRAFT_1056463 [Sistotremastrum suecicum HHB10207 ss-3]
MAPPKRKRMTRSRRGPQRKPEESKAARLGKTLVRFHRPYGRDLVDLLTVPEGEDGNIEEDDPETLDIVEFLDANSATFTKLRADEDKADEFIAYMAMLGKGQQEARSNDISDVKKLLVADKIVTFTPSLEVKKKSEWGARHPDILKLIVSVNEDPADAAVQKKYQLPGARLPPKCLPRFLWKNGVFNTQDPYAGAFEGQILVATVQKLISGLQFKSINANGKREVHTINARALAYCAMVDRFCLSSAARADDEPIRSLEFYNFVLGWLTDDSRVEFLEDLLRWYKSEVINAIDDESDTDSEQIPTASLFDNVQYVPRSARQSNTAQPTTQSHAQARPSSTLASSSTIANSSSPRRSPNATDSWTTSNRQADRLPASTQDRNTNETGNQPHSDDDARRRQLNNAPPQATRTPSRDTSPLSLPPNNHTTRQANTTARTRKTRRVGSDFESEEQDDNLERSQGENRDGDEDQDEDEPVAKRGRKSKTSKKSKKKKT